MYLKKITITFHNESNYDYHFIIKKLAEEFKKQFTCLGENTEKYITFTVQIEKFFDRRNFLEDLRNHRDIKLVSIERRRNYLL